MQKFEIHKTFVIATLLSVATHILLLEWIHITHHAAKQRTEPQLLQIHLAQRSTVPHPSPPEESPPEESPPEESPPEESPPEESPPEESPPAIFYKASELDVIPYAIEQIELAYPKNVDASSLLGGQVTLLLRIDEYGKVEDVEVIDANPPKVFDEAAKAGFLHRQFQAGIKSGWPVKSQIRIEVLFPPQLEIDH